MKRHARITLAITALAITGTLRSQVTYYKDVAPIFESKCQECHRPGEIGPFSTLTYKDVRPWAKAIRASVLQGTMPPWFADPAFGHFSNDRSLTRQQIDTITSWVDGGAKEGNPADAPAPRELVEGWNIPKPDFVISMKQPFNIPARGEIQYQYIVMPTGFTEDKWIQAVEARPSDRSVVHHVVVFIRDPKSTWLRDVPPGIAFTPPGGGKDFNNTSGGGNDILMLYSPGMAPEIWRPGLAKKIPAGADLVFQVHYTTNGKASQDLSKIGMVFAKEKPAERPITMAVSSLSFKIPPMNPHYQVTAVFNVPTDTEIISFFPHMHLRGKSFEYRIVYPDGRRETLLSVPRYDFYWQIDYKLTEPLKVPAGSRIEGTAWYDNSPNNPRNPDPTAEVRFGEQSREEMMFGLFTVVIPADMSRREYMFPEQRKSTEELSQTGNGGLLR